MAVLDLLMSDETNRDLWRSRSLMWRTSTAAFLVIRPPIWKRLSVGWLCSADPDSRTIQFYRRGAAAPAAGSGVAMLDRALEEVGVLVLSWAENLSRSRFDHASTAH